MGHISSSWMDSDISDISGDLDRLVGDEGSAIWLADFRFILLMEMDDVAC